MSNPNEAPIGRVRVANADQDFPDLTDPKTVARLLSEARIVARNESAIRRSGGDGDE